MNKTKMDFLLGVAKALLPQRTPTPRYTPALQFFFSYYCIASHSDWIMALMRTGQELLFRIVIMNCFVLNCLHFGAFCSFPGSPALF